jgi:uncharacterized protein with HEPN domain
MRRDDTVYVGHMMEMAEDAIGRLGARDFDLFKADDNLCLALTHLIQTIGESARRVSQEYRLLHPEVPWAIIVGMRHKIVHDYIHVDYETVWETVANDLPLLALQLRAILSE